MKVCRRRTWPRATASCSPTGTPEDRCVLIHTARGEWRAYRQSCTHLGCAVRWDGRGLQCPCHNGCFEVEQGFPTQGPPTRPLSRLAWSCAPTAGCGSTATCPSPGSGGIRSAHLTGAALAVILMIVLIQAYLFETVLGAVLDGQPGDAARGPGRLRPAFRRRPVPRLQGTQPHERR